jgi:hypothetical protein
MAGLALFPLGKEIVPADAAATGGAATVVTMP